jgi:hypothetical protein
MFGKMLKGSATFNGRSVPASGLTVAVKNKDTLELKGGAGS